MHSKVAAVLLAVLIIIGAAYLNDASKDPLFMCFKGKDTCIMDAIIHKRDARDSLKKELAVQIKQVDEVENPKIEALKLQLSVPFIQDEYKAGRKENIPTSLLQQFTGMIAPKAEASSNGYEDISFGEPLNVPVIAPNSIGAYLESKKSPYAHINFPELAMKNGLTMEQMTLLLSISGKESSFGTSFKKKDGPGYRFDNENGVKTHNPVGIKWCLHVDGCPPINAIPDENGFYLQNYKSWEQFWDTYTRQMKLVYFDGQCSTTDCMKNKYVGGDKAWKALWKKDVDFFINDMNAFGQKYYREKIAEHQAGLQ